MSTRAPRRRGLPGPFARLWRQPLRVGAIALLAVTALAASGIQSAAAMALRSTLDENWRGAYDILVTAPDGLQPIDGMLPPNTFASGEGITFDQLDAVRAVSGVDVAAPIGEVLAPGLKFGQGQLALPLGTVEGADRAAKAFRVTATYTTDDGLGERIVEQRSFPLIVDETPKEGMTPEQLAECVSGEVSVGVGNVSHTADYERYPELLVELCNPSWRGSSQAIIPDAQGTTTGTAPDPGTDLLRIQLPSAPQTIARLTLVDPVAERALLGQAGEFLDPLIETQATADTDVATMQAWADTSDGARAERLRDQLTRFASTDDEWTSEAAFAQLRQLFEDNGDDYDEQMAKTVADARFIPLLVSDAAVAQLRLKVDIEAFGDATLAVDERGAGGWELPAGLEEGSPGEVVGSAVGDISELLNPFAGESRPLVWPGVDMAVAAQETVPPVLTLFAAGAATAGAYGVSGDQLVQPAVGYTVPVLANQLPDAALSVGDMPELVGAEAAYLQPTTVWTPGTQGSPSVIPIGDFSPSDVALDESAADYVPLGAYAPVSSTLTSGEHAGTTMLPSLSGLGLVSSRTAAVGSIYSSPLWDDDAPISAIRVRVAGVDGYTPYSQQRVIDVAQAIEALGLSASVVAGSSPADVEVQVDGYAFGTTDPAGPQTVGELGVVAQRWSELGAASRVSLSVSTATLAILGIALAAGILLLGAVQLAGIPGRREQAVVMREIGFTRSRIARWFAAEEVPGLAVVAVVGCVAWWLSGGTRTATSAALVAAASVLVTATASVVAGSRSRTTRLPRDARSRRLGARSIAGFGARQTLVHPLTTVVHLLAIAIVGLSAAALAAALLTGRADAGASSLALLTVGQQLWPQLALGLAGIAGGVLLARLTRRLDLARRAEQWSTLRAAGWTSGQLARAQRVEGMTVVVPAIVLTAALAWLGAWWLDLAPAWVYAGIAAGGGLVTGLVAFSTRRKGSA